MKIHKPTKRQLDKWERDYIARQREELATSDWLNGLTHKDWLFDGAPIRGRVAIERFNNLDWGKAWLDLGPSIAGNLGPYWHVPLKETVIDGELYDTGGTVHRLYPRILQTKWLAVIRRAALEAAEKARTRNRPRKVIVEARG